MERSEKPSPVHALDRLAEDILHDPDPSVRSAAACALGDSWSEEAVVPSSHAVLDDRSASVREAAASALGVTWKNSAVAPFMAALSDPDGLVREQAARALGRTEEEEAVGAPVLLGAVEVAADPRMGEMRGLDDQRLLISFGHDIADHLP